MGDIVNSVADLFGLGPASKQASATEQAASQAAAAAKYATDVQQQMFNKQIELQTPWREAGVNALTQMQGGAYGLPGAFTGKVDLTQDPGYAFRLSEGMKGLERSAAARGGLMGGAQMKAMEKYGQGMASQEYQNAYQRALDAYNSQMNLSNVGYNRLASMAGLGQTSSNQLSSAAGQYGSNIGNIAMTNAANQGNAMLALGNIRASQYGTAGQGLNEALNLNWDKIGNYFGNPMTALKYGTDIGSEQTRMLAEQEAGLP